MISLGCVITSFLFFFLDVIRIRQLNAFAIFLLLCAVVEQAEAVLVFQPSPASFLLSRSLLFFFPLLNTLS